MELKQHVAWIDGMKGLLAIVVVMCHLRMAFAPIIAERFWIYQFPFSQFFAGGMAVAAFICLSSIVMTIKCEDDTKWQWVLLKRYFRLAFPIVPILLLYIMLWRIGWLYNNHLVEKLGGGISSLPPSSMKSIIKTMLTTPFGSGSQYLGVFWMLPYVFATPFVAVLLNIMTQKLSTVKFLGVLCACSLIAAILDPFWINVFIGYGIAKNIVNRETMHFLDIKRRWMLLGVLLLLYVISNYLPFFKAGIATVKGVLLVIFVIYSSLMQRILSFRPFVWLGRVSF